MTLYELSRDGFIKIILYVLSCSALPHCGWRVHRVTDRETPNKSRDLLHGCRFKGHLSYTKNILRITHLYSAVIFQDNKTKIPVKTNITFQFMEQEFPESKIDNDQLDKMHRDLRWLTINTDEGIGIGIR